MRHLQWGVMLWSMAAIGCAGRLPGPAMLACAGGAMGKCRAFYSAADRIAEAAGIQDGGAFRIDGYPYLRINRFLASFRDEIDTPAELDAWLGRMQALDRTARRFEHANLAAGDLTASPSAIDPDEAQHTAMVCGQALRAADVPTLDDLEPLREKATAPGEYRTLRRVLGLYPLMRPFVSNGVSRWHAEANSRFATRRVSKEDGMAFAPTLNGQAADARAIVPQVLRDALGIPLYRSEDLQALFHAYAPLWVVATESDADRIGAPFWKAERQIGIDPNQRVTYTQLTFTRFHDQVLTQLNYIVWFPARPKPSPLDLYGGLLDGITYRVTLDRRGDPLLYETIHNCGCYYMAFPSPRLKTRETIDYPEPPLIFAAPEVDPATALMAVVLTAGTHQVVGLSAMARATRGADPTYALADYDQLRSLPRPEGGRRSLFDPDGLVEGTERLERWLLWPTGVPSPGAMRQLGRHAVAFVGDRHFDDPFFLQHIFHSATAED